MKLLEVTARHPRPLLVTRRSVGLRHRVLVFGALALRVVVSHCRSCRALLKPLEGGGVSSDSSD
jgi:hypothetical protein